jgi:hypothetical protein
MAIRDNFPSTTPSLVLDFVNSRSLNPNISFTRSTTATYIDRNGLLKNAAINEPRFDYDISTKQCYGLLSEEASTNNMNAAAGDSGYNMSSGPTAASDLGPDGVSANCKYDCTSTSSAFISITNSTTLTAGVTYTASIFVKADQAMSNNNFAIIQQDGGQSIYTQSRNIGTTWSRVQFTFTPIQTTSNWRMQFFFASQSNGRIVYFWGAQVEAKTKATSYIRRTGGAAVTREYDLCEYYLAGSNIYNQESGTLVVRARVNLDPISAVRNRSFAVIESSVAQGGSIWLNWWENSNVLATLYQSPSNTYVATLNSAISATSGNSYTIATSYSVNNFNISANGSAVVTDTSGEVPTSVDRIWIGSFVAGHNLTGHIQKLIYYPQSVSNTALRTLSRG